MSYLRFICVGSNGGQEVSSMTSIRVDFTGKESFGEAKAKALGLIVEELSRYGLAEALSGIGIMDEYRGAVVIREANVFEIKRLQAEIGELQTRLAYLVLGDPRTFVTMPATNAGGAVRPGG